MMDSPELCPLVDEGWSKKHTVVFEQFQNDFYPSRDKVTECAIADTLVLYTFQTVLFIIIIKLYIPIALFII